MNPWHLPPLIMPWSEWSALREYSRSFPTGASPGVTWRRWEPPFWVVGRYEEIPGDPHNVAVAWYYPAPLPEGGTLTERRGWWIGQTPGFTMASWDWHWVCRELWRHAGHRMGIWRGYRRPALERVEEGT